MKKYVAAAAVPLSLLALAVPASAHRPPKGRDHIEVAGTVRCAERTVTWRVHNPTRRTVMHLTGWTTAPVASAAPATVGSDATVEIVAAFPAGTTVASADASGLWVETDRADTAHVTLAIHCATPATVRSTVPTTGPAVTPPTMPVTGGTPGPLALGGIALAGLGGLLAAAAGRRRRAA